MNFTKLYTQWKCDGQICSFGHRHLCTGCKALRIVSFYEGNVTKTETMQTKQQQSPPCYSIFYNLDHETWISIQFNFIIVPFCENNFLSTYSQYCTIPPIHVHCHMITRTKPTNLAIFIAVSGVRIHRARAIVTADQCSCSSEMLDSPSLRFGLQSVSARRLTVKARF